ncbi:GNAT family N-acetyltransferase [Streptomyces ovatisporus]|uniref:GNAT family N-acetyltransferase n=1 Tax=Streptomyces ovatisporus TaxID=1128682 RepID=A0ABV9A7W7_9ACTN
MGPDEWRLLRDVRLTALDRAGGYLDGERAAEATAPPAYWRDLLATSTVWQAARGEETVGLVQYRSEDGIGFLSGLWVEPHDRSRGLARRLVATVIAHSREQGDSELRAYVAPANRPVVRVLRSVGARPTGRLRIRAGTPHGPRLEVHVEHERNGAPRGGSRS